MFIRNQNEQPSMPQSAAWPKAIIAIAAPELKSAAVRLRSLPFETFSRTISSESIEALEEIANLLGVPIVKYHLRRRIHDGLDQWRRYGIAKNKIYSRLNKLLMVDAQYYNEDESERELRLSESAINKQIESAPKVGT